jgi:group I intron endonuclease
MYYTIYKITNKLNNKFYIGMHQTRDLNDGYMGSGKLLKRAISKYGIENFSKEILHIFENEIDMRNKEKELVVLDKMSYNLLEGGLGGFGYINRKGINFGGDHIAASKVGRKKADVVLQKKYGENWRSVLNKMGHQSRLKTLRERYPNGTKGFLNKKHTQETKDIIGKKNSIHQQGSNNSVYGTCWVTDGQESVRIKKEALDEWLQKGYRKGRVMK